jgi:hypothetical protein
METTKTTRSRWKPPKGVIPAFLFGMLVGPMVLSYFGVTVTSRTANASLREGVLQLQASLCEIKARTEVVDPAKLDGTARHDLAAKHAATQPNGNADYEVVNLCSNKLGA